MKIAILGTKGIPNNYGGYEQFAEYISGRLVERGHEVTVYNPSFHAFKEKKFNGVTIIRKFSPEKLIGGSANFIYDFLCLKDALKRDFDIIYEAGYHSVAYSYKLLGVRKIKHPVILTNMDGLEYNRSKWNNFTQNLIRKLEKIAIAESPYMISDNLGIQEYYKKNFSRDSYFISYGADPVEHFDDSVLKSYSLEKFSYLMLVARLEPENNIEIVLKGYVSSGSALPFIVVGNNKTAYGKYLEQTYGSERIRFVGGIYNKSSLDSIRHFATGYFHGHSVGGTNPSLLEAMACKCFILAHDNPFNRMVLFDSALYFKNDSEVSSQIKNIESLRALHVEKFRQENDERIRKEYNWDRIVTQHEQLFEELSKKT